MRRLKNRKGIFIVLFGLLFMVLMAVSAMAVDMSRIWTMRNELQTAADAGALAGAIQLSPPHQRGGGSGTNVRDTATWAARSNLALYDTVRVDSVNAGIWDDAAATFANSNWNNATAVEVVVSHGTNKLIIGALGIAAPRVKARAIGWANAPVDNANCMKPWSMPYTVLMDIVNRKRVALGTLTGDPDSFANLTRDFTDEDRQLLADMTDAERTFTLKMGSGQNGLDEAIPGATMPGNFQAVKLPRYKSADGTLWPDGQPQGMDGADSYRDSIEGTQCFPLGVGDTLAVKTGNMVGPTLQAVEKQNPGDQNYICASIASNGDCMNDQGTAGVDIKTAFHQCVSGCNGATLVAVRMIGSFTLSKMYKTNGNAQQGENWDMGQIVGIFKPLASTGPVGAGPTTIRKIILVR